MNTFGVTNHGPPSYIKYTQRENFLEPLHMPISSHLTKTDAPLPEKNPVSEVYHPSHSYSSYDLLQFIKRKGIPKTTGPQDEFRLPATTTMDYGWYNHDPDLCGNWYLVRHPTRRASTDATRFRANLKPFERFYFKL